MKASDLEAVFATVPASWAAALPGWTSEKTRAVCDAVEVTSGDRDIAPDDPFRALRLVDPAAVKVVVIGQDPYPTAGHADGLAFSAGRGHPRSLARVFEVLAQDRENFAPPKVWMLDDWARRGVLLLNPVLTVEVGQSASHTKSGWQALTSEVVDHLSRRDAPPVFLLWGSKARSFWESSKSPKSSATVLTTRHPSYDFDRRFMSEGSHFEATGHLVDWWAIGPKGQSLL